MAESVSEAQAQFRALGAQSRAKFDAGLAVMAQHTQQRFQELRALLWRFSSMQPAVDPAHTQAVWDEHVRAVVLLQELRRLNRKMHVAPLDLMSPVGKARDYADLTTLTYQDKLYLKHYIQALIHAEREDGTNEHKVLLTYMLSEADFHGEMGAKGVGLDDISRNRHQLMLRRLEHEGTQRRELMHRAEELARRLDVIVAISDTKAKTLAGLEPKVDRLLAVCTDVCQGSGGSDDLLSLLPDDLYSVYTHVAACIRAHDLTATVSIQGSASDVRACSQAMGKDTIPTKAALIKPFPLSVDIAFKSSGHEVVLNVHYLPQLPLLVVGGKDSLRDGRATSLVPSHWATSALVDEVYPDDRGRRLPFDARCVAERLATVGASVDDVIKGSGGRPYCWAQWLAGPDMVHRQTGQTVSMCERAHRQHVHQVLGMVVQRMDALSALYRQLAALASHQVDLGPLPQARLKELFPLKTNSTVNKFSLISDKHSLEFNGYLTNGDYELELRIKVPIDYPIRLPEYALSLRKGVAEGDTPWCLRHMEHEVNTGHGLAGDPQSRNYILALQMRRLQEVFDAYVRIVQATVDDSVLGRLYERRTKGRDRRMPTRFSGQLRQYVFD